MLVQKPENLLMQNHPSPWLTLKQAAERAGLSPATIGRAAKSRTLTAVKVNNGRIWRFRADWVDDYLERGTEYARADGGDQVSPKRRDNGVRRATGEERRGRMIETAGKLLASDIGRAAVLLILQDENRRLCDPPLNDQELAEIAERTEPSTADADDSSDSTVLVRLASEGDVEFFHDRNHEAFVTMRFEDHLETWSLRQSAYSRQPARGCGR